MRVRWESDLNTGCWNWLGGKTDGYGRVTVKGRKLYAHRVMYAETLGPIPNGYQIDHKCENRACVNPKHLVCITQVEHLEREHTRRFGPKLDGYCRKGHQLEGGITPCRVCRRLYMRRYRSQNI